MATFAPRPNENTDPWYGARETYDQSLEAAIAANETALGGKVPTTRTVAGKALTSDVTLVKGDVGLGNVDNTSDAAKPISTATQTALNAKLATAEAPELIRDTMGTALVAGSNITITPDDGADTITIAASGGGGMRWWRSGNYITNDMGPIVKASAVTNARTISQVGFFPIDIPESHSANGVGVGIATAGPPGAVVRFGLFDFDPAVSLTATLIADWGTSPADVTGVVQKSFSSAPFAAGDRIWVGVCTSDASVQFYGYTAMFGWYLSAGDLAGTAVRAAIRSTATTGNDDAVNGFAASYSTNVWAESLLRVGIKR